MFSSVVYHTCCTFCSLLVNVFMYDIKLSENGTTTRSPQRELFLRSILTKLECLKDVRQTNGANNGPGKSQSIAGHVTQLMPSFLTSGQDSASDISQSGMIAKLHQDVTEHLKSRDLSSLPPQVLEMIKKSNIQVSGELKSTIEKVEALTLQNDTKEVVAGKDSKVQSMDVDSANGNEGENGESEEHKTAVRFCKTGKLHALKIKLENICSKKRKTGSLVIEGKTNQGQYKIKGTVVLHKGITGSG